MPRALVRTAICSGALLLTLGCARKQSIPPEVQKAPPTLQANQPTPSSEEPETKWVTVSLELGIFGPDGKQRRWVKLRPNQPVRLGPGEFVTVHGTKYTGRAAVRSEIWLESGEVKARNVEITTEKN